MGYKVPEASPLRFCTSEPDSSSVGFSRKASSVRKVWSDMRTERSCLPMLVTLHRVTLRTQVFCRQHLAQRLVQRSMVGIIHPARCFQFSIHSLIGLTQEHPHPPLA